MHDLPRTRNITTLLALVGCVDVGHPLRRAIGPTVARTRAQDEAAERARLAALPRIPTDQRGSPLVVGTEGDVTHGLFGPLRFDLRRGAATPAEEITAEPIALAQRGPRGWIFVTPGAVYASPTFTGRLRPLRSDPCQRRYPWLTSHPSVGRVALTGGDEGALWSDGQTLHELGVPGAVSLAWRDDAWGAVVADDLTLRVTHDGGHSWRVVDLRGELPVEVQGDAAGLTVVTDAGERRITQHDALVPLPAREAIDRYRFPSCDPPPDAVAAIERLADRGYALAPDVPPRESCAQATARAGFRWWSSPSFVVHLNGVTSSGGSSPGWVIPGKTRSPLGSPASRSFADSGEVPTVVSVAVADDPRRGRPVALAWRGEDGGGPFAGRIHTTVPREILPDLPWTLVAATRRGLLFDVAAHEQGAADLDFDTDVHPYRYWFSTGAVRRTPVRPAQLGGIFGVVPLDDGGVLLSGHFDVAREHLGRERRCDGAPYRAPVTIQYVSRLGPDGAELARRVYGPWPSVGESVGLGEVDGRRGLVVARRENPAALTLLPLDGGELPFGEWRFAGAPPVCGDAVEGAATLHLANAGIRIAPQPDGSNFAEPRLVTFERSGDHVCLRRVWGTHGPTSYEVDGVSRDAWASLRLNARQGRLAGIYDDGVHTATAEATVVPRGADR